MSRTKDSAEEGTNAVYEPDSDESPSMAVVAAVADATGRSPTELEPIHWSVDPEALNGMLATTGANGAVVTTTFEYGGCQVTVSPGEVQVDRQE